MKKYIFSCLVAVLAVTAAFADDFTDKQLSLRREVVSFLVQKGFRPSIDPDGDIKFEMEGSRYYAIVNKDWEDPYVITLYKEYSYEDNITQKVVLNFMSAVGQAKTVKLFPSDTYYSMRSDVFCRDAATFTNSFDAIMEQFVEARNTFLELYNSGLADVDLSNPDSIFTKAKSFYYNNDDAKAFKLFKMLERQGYAPSYRFLASSYRHGYGTPKDYSMMEKYYKKAIETGDMRSAYNLGDFYYESKDYRQAYNYMSICANNDGPSRSDALYVLGYMNEKGLGTDMDMKQAKDFYRKSIQCSTSKACDARKAMLRLGEQPEKIEDFTVEPKTSGMTASEMYTRGQEYEYGLSKRFVSLPKAFAYYQAAADNGYVNAFVKMGRIYIDPYYPFDDKAKSDKWYQKAMKVYKKSMKTDGNACYQIGLMYENGYGVDVNKKTAYDYYQKGSDLNNKNAMYKYAMSLKEDNEYPEAFKLFKKAAEKGQSDAMYELAYLYEVGYGTQQNREEAVRWYRKCYYSFDDKWQDAKKALERLGAMVHHD